MPATWFTADLHFGHQKVSSLTRGTWFAGSRGVREGS